MTQSCFAAQRSRSAFSELVHRYVDLVYGAALRRTSGDPHRAAEVSRQVFTALARHAEKLSYRTVLPAFATPQESVYSVQFTGARKTADL
jgi:DNA-directed RNA polymerase specialized sigma24 family protein